MHNFPRPAEALRCPCERVLGVVVLVETKGEIPSLPDVEFSVRVEQDVNVPAQA